MVPTRHPALALLLVLGLLVPTVGAWPIAAPDAPAAPETTGFPEAPTTATEALLLAVRLAGLDVDEVVALAEATRDGGDSGPEARDAHRDLLAALAPYGLIADTAPAEDLAGDPAADPWALLPPPARDGLARLLDGLADATRLHTEAIQGLDVGAARALHEAWRTSRTTGDRAVLADAFETTGGLPDGLDRTRLAASAYRILLAAEDARPHLETAHRMLTAGDASWPDGQAIPASSGLCIEDPTALVIVCGPDAETIQGDRLLVVDLGGDDQHHTNAGGAGIDVLWSGNNGLPVALSLDVAGDDTYLGDDSVQAAGSTAAGILLDWTGLDTYTATDDFFTFAQGAGNLGGVGLLHDALGDDTYRAPGLTQSGGGPAWDTQGFGILGGIGIIHDPVGEDLYAGGAMAQGVGDFQALGLLVDAAGADIYGAERLSQGFADGLGVAAFWDAAGDDRHRIEGAYGQGAAIGGHALFVDTAGADDYLGTGTVRGHGDEGPAWRPIQELLWLAGYEPVGTAFFLDASGDDDYDGARGCDLCAWTGGLGGVGVDLG